MSCQCMCWGNTSVLCYVLNRTTCNISSMFYLFVFVFYMVKRLNRPSQCSQKCGGGQQNRTVSCLSSPDGFRISDEFCVNQPREETVQRCNTDSCPEWVTGELTPVVITMSRQRRRKMEAFECSCRTPIFLALGELSLLLLVLLLLSLSYFHIILTYTHVPSRKQMWNICIGNV